MVTRSGREQAERRREGHVDRLVGAILDRPRAWSAFAGRRHLSRAAREQASRARQATR